MGSPAVSAERLSGGEMLEAIKEMLYFLRHDSFDAVMGVEIGGANGLQTLLWGSSKNFDRPIVDADWMGMYSCFMYFSRLLPLRATTPEN